MDIEWPGEWHMKSMAEVWGGTPHPRLNQDIGNCRYDYDLQIVSNFSTVLNIILAVALTGTFVALFCSALQKWYTKRQQRNILRYQALNA